MHAILTFFSIPSWDDVTRKSKIYTFTLASYLTDPVCNFDADSLYLQEKVFTRLFPSDGSFLNQVGNWMRAGAIATNLAVNLLLTPITAPLGILLRCLGTNMSSEPFCYEITGTPPKPFPSDGSFRLDNWNTLLIPGKNSVLHGGAPQADSPYIPASKDQPARGLPYCGLEWLFDGILFPKQCTTRLETIIEEIRNSDADVVCLYEGFDFGAVRKIIAGVEDRFHCIVSNIAPRSVGPNSGVVILSKFPIPIDSLVIQPFPKEYKGPDETVISLGESGYCEKALVTFSVVGEDPQGKTKPIARIAAEHLSHSSRPDPQYVTQEEKIIRKQQLHQVFTELHKDLKKEEAVLLCGDLNQDPQELQEHLSQISKELPRPLSLTGKMEGMITWGGDATSAAIEGIDPSEPQQLDYVMAFSNTVESIDTEAHNLGNFDPNVLRWDYRSDHYYLKTKVQLNKSDLRG